MRLTKMYLYKLQRSAGLWICMLLTCMLVVMPGLIRLFFPDLFGTSGMYSAAGALLSAVTGGLPCMICAIYAAVFFHDDEKYGFIKNIFPKLPHKMELFTARLAVSLLLLLAMYLAGFLTALLFTALLHGTVIGEAGSIPLLLLSFLSSAAFLSLVLTLELHTRSNVLPIVLSVISMSGMISLMCTLLSFLLNQLLKTESVALDQYVVSCQLRNLSTFAMADRPSMPVTVILVSAVYLIISAAWSYLLLYRRDIR